MKLEIKHILPYLEYELDFLMEPGADSPEPNIDSLKSIDVLIKYVNFGHGNAKQLHEIKPLLRPLSDIVNHMSEIIPLIEIHSKNLEIEVEQISDMLPVIMSNYDIASKLFEFHYDVFGLIEKGLAINLNDIK